MSEDWAADTDGTDPEREPPLAAVVEKPRAEAVIAACRAEGVYDADRSVRELDDAVAVPVTEAPADVAVRDVVAVPGQRRLRTLDDHLRERGWTERERETAPSSWAVVGSVVVVDAGETVRPTELGEALLAMHGETDTVIDHDGVDGPHREPAVTVLAGSGDTETVHAEHGTSYALDLSEVMFSPGNKAERARMGEVVAAGERVLDMFAGIGYFTLPMARAGAEVTAIERNPTAFRYLLENARLNGVDDRVSAYRADCRDVAPAVSVERAVLGYFDATAPADGDESADPAVGCPDGPAYPYLDAALAALEPGGVVHAHEATPEARVFDRPVERLREAAAERDRSVDVTGTRRVKGYSEGVAHVVVDAVVA